jgi:hypothetical protein
MRAYRLKMGTRPLAHIGAIALAFFGSRALSCGLRWLALKPVQQFDG